MKQSLRYPYRSFHICDQLQVAFACCQACFCCRSSSSTQGAVTPYSRCLTSRPCADAGLPSSKASAPEQDRQNQAHMQVADGQGTLNDVCPLYLLPMLRQFCLNTQRIGRAGHPCCLDAAAQAGMLQPKLDRDNIMGTMKMLEAEMKGF